MYFQTYIHESFNVPSKTNKLTNFLTNMPAHLHANSSINDLTYDAIHSFIKCNSYQ